MIHEQVYYPISESQISSLKPSTSTIPLDTLINSIIDDNNNNNDDSNDIISNNLGIDESTLLLLHESKEGLGKIIFRSEYSYSNLRSVCNYYEQLAKGPDLVHIKNKKCFINRSAMKIVNLDYAYNLVEMNNNDKFTFVDLAGGPGILLL